MQRVITIGISDCAVSREQSAILTTHALGSCIAVVIHDPVVQVTGLLHFLLPDSTLNADRHNAQGEARPCMFADTGIPMLFRRAYQLGADRSRLLVASIGGAQVIGSQTQGALDSFNVGKWNALAARRILKQAGIPLHAEDVGGRMPRTVRVEVGSGRIIIACDRQEQVLRFGHGEGSRAG